jgi:adenine phosphoribosyltransferase
VLIHDDLLATGGTAGALCDLVAGLGGEIVGCAFLVELTFLGGRRRLAPHHVYSLIEYDK